MRKLIVGFVAVAMTTFGLVSVSGAPASATHCPYTGCVRTVTNIKAPGQIVAGGLLPIKVTVSAAAGTAEPHGKLKASCSRPGKTKTKHKGYHGESRYVFFKLRKPAIWTCTVTFTSPRKFKSSSDSETVRVVHR